MKLKKIYPLITTALVWTPLVALAAAKTKLTEFIEEAGNLIKLAFPVAIALGVLYFIWGVVQYVTSAGDETKRKEGQTKIMYGLIGLFVLVAFWGVVAIIQYWLIGGQATTAPPLPLLPT